MKEEVTDMKEKDTVGNDYLLEAFFIPFFNNILLKPLVREAVSDSIQDIYLGEVIEDMVNVEVEN